MTPHARRPDTSGGLSVVHTAHAYAVIDKPSGLLSVPGRAESKQDCVTTRVRALFPSATGPIIVHRLDMETSGLMVVALCPDAHRELSGQFMRREVQKRYTAIAHGDVQRDEGVIDLPIRADWPNRPRQVPDRIQGKPAKTRFEVLGRAGGTTRLWLYPETGRSHQLRVHCATPAGLGGLGTPIAGDPLYGEATSAPRLMLHAESLAFRDPDAKCRVEFTRPAPF